MTPEQAQRQLLSLAGLLDRREVRLSIAETLLQRQRQRHERKAAPDGKPWTPLAASTVAAKGHNTPLKKTGQTLRALNSAVVGDEVQVGFWQAKLPPIHHYGTKAYVIRPKNKKALKLPGGRLVKRVNHPGIPARPLVGWGQGDEVAVQSTLESALRVLVG